MRLDPAALRPLDAACRLTVALPAKNEQVLIGAALEAFAQQRLPDGLPLAPSSFEIIVFCNDCGDGTAGVARRFAARHRDLRVHVIEGVLPAGHAHVGTARRAALDLAASRFLGAGRPRGIVASADADSIVAPTWVASTIAEMNRADAVAGAVEIEPRERERMLAPLRLLYDRELAYRGLLGEIEERFDPRPFDPAPRHDAFVAASFAVAAETYRDAAGLPGLPRLEDLAFSHALRRIDARVRHSYAVRVATSARRLARVDGGFGTFVGELELRSSRGETFFVRAAASTIAEARARAALRRIRRGAAEEPDADVAREFFNLPIEALRDIVAGAASFGSGFERALEAGAPRLYRDEPVESAITALREALTWRNPAVPTRASAASGAG